MVKVRREHPSQRRHHRVEAPLMLTIDNENYSARNWGLGGFLLEGTAFKELAVGQDITCQVVVPFQGFEVSFDAVATVRRQDGTQTGFEFASLDERATGLLTHFIDQLIMGHMSALEDTIQRIDVPVTPVSTKPDPNPAEELPVRRWPIRQMVMTGVYFGAGLAVVLYVVSVLYTNFLKLEVDSAVVTAPVETLVSTADGKVTAYLNAPGDFVRTGTPLIRIQNPLLEERIGRARNRLDTLQQRHALAKRRVTDQESKFDDYERVANANIEKLHARMSGLTEELATAEAERDRVTTLFADGWVTRARVETTAAEVARVRATLEVIEIERSQALNHLKSAVAGRYFDGRVIDDDLVDAQREVELIGVEIQEIAAELSTLEEHRTRLIVRAPFDGRLLRQIKSTGSVARHGETLALFERDEERVIEAFLTQEEISRIRIGENAFVYFPSLDWDVEAQVLSVDRTDGFLSEVAESYSWRGPKDRTARVLLTVTGHTAAQVREHCPPGTPAIVLFDKQTNHIGARKLFQWL